MLTTNDSPKEHNPVHSGQAEDAQPTETKPTLSTTLSSAVTSVRTLQQRSQNKEKRRLQQQEQEQRQADLIRRVKQKYIKKVLRLHDVTVRQLKHENKMIEESLRARHQALETDIGTQDQTLADMLQGLKTFDSSNDPEESEGLEADSMDMDLKDPSSAAGAGL
ncbi:hypothetical protein BGZ83_006681 [Gryganskiella cystojenkinii]|nr:hypothetical protein BGZ83_006681 [Gryganskiella cystojenkinii]